MAQSDLRKVKVARERLAAAEQAVADAIVSAHESGESLRDIGKWAGLSHQRVHEIIREEEQRQKQEN